MHGVRSGWLLTWSAVIAVIALVIGIGWAARPSYLVAGYLLGLLLIAHDASRGHTVDVRRAALFTALSIIAVLAATKEMDKIALILILAACSALAAPAAPPPPANRQERKLIWSLIDGTSGDTLAPFALRTDKSCIFSDDGRAAMTFRVRWGTAVASGDPLGDPSAHAAVIDAFCAQADANGWRIAALGIGPRTRALWQAKGLWSLSIGREVIIDTATFAMQGRRFRNLRQAVQHTHNCGVTSEILLESSLSLAMRQELSELLRQTPKGLHPRGFVMILDHPLRVEHPGTYFAIARDRSGRAVGCQRYAIANQGRDFTLDIPWRLRDAPNGTDERLIIDMIEWAREHGGRRVSLSFAPFPDLFGTHHRSLFQKVMYAAAHLLDRFIQLESLYRFLRKFHSFGDHRYVALRPREMLPAAAAILSLEFGPPPKLRDATAASEARHANST